MSAGPVVGGMFSESTIVVVVVPDDS